MLNETKQQLCSAIKGSQTNIQGLPEEGAREALVSKSGYTQATTISLALATHFGTGKSQRPLRRAYAEIRNTKGGTGLECSGARNHPLQKNMCAKTSKQGM